MAPFPLVEPPVVGNLAGSCRDEKAARLTDSANWDSLRAHAVQRDAAVECSG